MASIILIVSFEYYFYIKKLQKRRKKMYRTQVSSVHDIIAIHVAARSIAYRNFYWSSFACTKLSHYKHGILNKTISY